MKRGMRYIVSVGEATSREVVLVSALAVVLAIGPGHLASKI